MTLELIHVAARIRTLVAGAVVALVCSACASEQTVATMPAGSMGPSTPPPMASKSASARQIATASPAGYPMPNNNSELIPSSYATPTGNR